MLAISDRDKPCRARTSPSSLGLVTVIDPSACVTSIGAATSRLRRPFGPCTTTSRPLMVTSTPPGMTTGMRPIRDIAGSLPDVGEDFSAYALLVRLLVGHQPGRGGDNRDTKAAQDPGKVVPPRIDPQAGLGYPLEPGNRALASRPELQRDHEALADFGGLHPPSRDVALLLEDLGDMHLDLGVRHGHCVVVCRVGIAQTGQHVCDRVGHCHGLVALLAAVSLRTFGVVGGRQWRPGCLSALVCRRALSRPAVL